MATQWACEPFVQADDVLAADCGCPFDADIDDIAGYIDAATDILFQLTGGRVHGRCVRKVRPMTRDYGCLPRRHRWNRDEWYDDYASALGGLTPVRLRGPNPVINQIKVDGVVLGNNEFAIVDEVFLIRRDGHAWPSRNDLRWNDDQLNTWSITYQFGDPPDLITRQATVELVCELAKADGIGNKIGFGANVISANVQGVTLAMADRVAELAEGRENLPYIGRFLGIYAPGVDGRHATTVYSPELNEPYRLVEVDYL